MNIQTKYSIGDKVWYYIEGHNKYSWGKITDISTTVKETELVDIAYCVENRHHNKEAWRLPYYDRREDPRDGRSRAFKEGKLFETVEQLKEHLNELHKKEMNNLKELESKWYKKIHWI